MMRLVTVFSCLLVGLTCLAQEELAGKSMDFSLMLDYGKLTTITSDFERKYELGAEMRIKKYVMVAEYGGAKFTPESAFENGTYLSDGNYWRIGGGYVIYQDTKARVGISARYASSSFRDKGSYIIESPSELQPDIEEYYSRNNLTANWYEAVLFSDRQLKSWVSFGFQFRLRFLLTYDKQPVETIDVYAIPGYGRSADQSVPAVNFMLRFHPF
jgi:hypothetical protein